MISAIPKATISNLTTSYLASYFLNKKQDNKLYSEDFEFNSEIKCSDDLEYFGGLFNLPETNSMLTDILFDRVIDSTNKELSIAFLNSKKGIKIQKGRFRDEYLKPVNKWLRNRNIMNKDFAMSLMRHKVSDSFSDIVKKLDETKDYSTIGIAKANLKLT